MPMVQDAIREAQLNAIRVEDAALNPFSENAPGRSRSEMEALAAMPDVKTVRLPAGKLSVYEEFRDACVVRKFLA